MNRIVLAITLTAMALTTGMAQKPGPHEAEFKAFYAKFLAAARANDKEKIADLIAFPVEWSVETRGDVQTASIKDRAEFLAKYSTLFTLFMRQHIPRAKLKPLDDGGYFIAWVDSNSEFSFDFAYTEEKGYQIRSYGVGPR